MDVIINVRNILVLSLTKFSSLSIKQTFFLETGKMHVLDHLTTHEQASAQSYHKRKVNTHNNISLKTQKCDYDTYDIK